MSGASLRWVAGAALLTCSCTTVTRLGVGPVVAFPDHQGASYGDELLLRRGIGTSDFSSIKVAEYEARALVTERSQALSLGAGPTYMPWLGPALVSMSAVPAVGIEHVDDKVLGNFGAHGGLGLGFILAENFRQSLPMHLPDVVSGMTEAFVKQSRERTLLGLELTGSVDLRGTRAPLYAVGLLINLSFTEEWREEYLPRFAPPFGFPGGL